VGKILDIINFSSSFLSISITSLLINGPVITFLYFQLIVSFSKFTKYKKAWNSITMYEQIVECIIGLMLLITNGFLFATFCTDPGIIPAKIWGNVLPAKYKGVDVHFLKHC